MTSYTHINSQKGFWEIWLSESYIGVRLGPRTLLVENTGYLASVPKNTPLIGLLSEKMPLVSLKVAKTMCRISF